MELVVLKFQEVERERERGSPSRCRVSQRGVALKQLPVHHMSSLEERGYHAREVGGRESRRE